jgi:hypothetical protein
VIGPVPALAGEDVHSVIETRRSQPGPHHYGGIGGTRHRDPEPVDGIAEDRVLRAPAEEFRSSCRIGDSVVKGAGGCIGDAEVIARIGGVLRGLVPGTWVTAGLKIGDVDPRGDVTTFSFQTRRAIAGRFWRPCCEPITVRLAPDLNSDCLDIRTGSERFCSILAARPEVSARMGRHGFTGAPSRAPGAVNESHVELLA